MSLLSDRQIIEYANKGMITPFEHYSVSSVSDLTGIPKGVISYGPSSYGYDARLAGEFELFTPYPGIIMDVKAPDPRLFLRVEADEIILPPHAYVLCRTVETFVIPSDVLAICVGKSSYARCGLIVNVTPLEPEWCGEVTLEISNPTPIPCRIYAGEGICQFLFLRGETACSKTYANKRDGNAGKYHRQRGIVHSR